MRSPLSFCFFALVMSACAASTSSDPSSDVDSDAQDLSSASDKVLIANAEALFDEALYQGGNGDKLQITYEQLGSKLEAMVKQNNPDPKDEWAARAYLAKVKSSSGVLTNVVLIMDNIDDEGETDTLYTVRGRELATGGTYRSTLPTWTNITK